MSPFLDPLPQNNIITVIITWHNCTQHKHNGKSLRNVESNSLSSNVFKILFFWTIAMCCFVEITWWPFLKRVNTGKYLIKYDWTKLSLKLSMGMVFQCWGSGSPKEGDYFSGSNRIPPLIMMMLAMEKLMNRWNFSWKQKMGIFPPFYGTSYLVHETGDVWSMDLW